MAKKRIIFTFLSLLIGVILLPKDVFANTKVYGLFEEIVYDVQYSDKGELLKKEPKQLKMTNTNGTALTYKLNSYSKLTVDHVPVQYNAYKKGMEIEVVVRNNTVIDLNGFSTLHPGEISFDSKTVTGTVTDLAPNGSYLKLRTVSGEEQTYFTNENTVYLQDNKRVDRSYLFVGDEVKLQFNQIHSNSPTTIEIKSYGTKIKNVYRGKIVNIDPLRNIINLEGVKQFRNWEWQTFTGSGAMKFSFDANQTIYYNNKVVDKKNVRTYEGLNVYIVTKEEYGTEKIARMVINENYETTLYDYVSSVNLSTKRIGIGGKLVPYHDGTIFIRNGRLVESFGIQSLAGHAQVFLDGTSSGSFASVVYLVNDGKTSPNLTDHQVYYGKLAFVSFDKLQVAEAQQLINHGWSQATTKVFDYDNDTAGFRNITKGPVNVMVSQFPQQIGKYAYIHTINDRVVSIHFVENRDLKANLVSTGIVETIDTSVMEVKNVSRMQSNGWVELGLLKTDIQHTTIIKDGKNISKNDIKVGDRVYMIHDNKLKVRYMLVN